MTLVLVEEQQSPTSLPTLTEFPNYLPMYPPLCYPLNWPPRIKRSPAPVNHDAVNGPDVCINPATD